jgi:hypothetical protein
MSCRSEPYSSLALLLLFIRSSMRLDQERQSLRGRAYGRCRMEYGTMDWNLNWRFWRGEALPEASMGMNGGTRREPRTAEDFQTRLIERGVPTDSASLIAAQLVTAYAELGRGSAAALLLGATLTVDVQAAERADVERNMRDVREVERLLGAFSGELEKLDEVLEVLAAYAQRMRAKPSRPAGRTLH